MFQHLILVLFGSLLLAAKAQDTERPQLILTGSDNQCEGLVEILHPFNLQNEGPYGQACREEATGDAEAMVICRQLGCNPSRAQRVDPDLFGFSEVVDVYVAFNYSCTGNELRITDCQQIPFSEAMRECNADQASSAIAVRCGEGSLTNPNEAGLDNNEAYMNAPAILLTVGLLVLTSLILN